MLFLTTLFAVAAAGPMSMSEPRLVKEELGLCSPCIQLSEQGLNILLNEILNVGVVGGCSKLCSAIPSKAGSTVCDLACIAVGLKEFVSIIEKADLDPFYFCEQVKFCPVGKDDAAGQIMAITSDPTSGPAATKFAINMQFQVANETGVGEIHAAIKGPGATSISQGFPNTGFKPGMYQVTLNLDTTPDQTADPPVDFPAGVYDIKFDVCQGECYSKHPHSIVLDSQHGNFTITH
mmetsp:Transcript_12687/g.17632  ORF Transcript_12687/g.17632 Transcript_12687/m.17632 type:complete len:235 (-) Transcript_12687:172-876(-)